MACGGLPFAVGSLELDAGLATQLDAGVEIDAWVEIDAGPGDSDSADASDSSAAVKDARPPQDACIPGTPWICGNSTVEADQYCVEWRTSPAVFSYLVTATPSPCDCTNTCACLIALNPCGNHTYVQCTQGGHQSPFVLCQE